MNKVCTALNNAQAQKEKEHKAKMLQNAGNAKTYKFNKDQVQPKTAKEFPIIDDLLKDIASGQSLLGLVLFYSKENISIDGKNV